MLRADWWWEAKLAACAWQQCEARVGYEMACLTCWDAYRWRTLMALCHTAHAQAHSSLA